MNKKLNEECGIFGIYDTKKNIIPNIGTLSYNALSFLQHRGQDSAGITVINNDNIITHKDIGLVKDVFKDINLNEIIGHQAIGHVRYATSKIVNKINSQPFQITHPILGNIYLSHNGHINNTKKLKEILNNKNIKLDSESDSEIILKLMLLFNNNDLLEILYEICNMIKGSYSIIVMSKNEIVALRDSLGFRPLYYGKMNDSTYCFASETCALKKIGIQKSIEVKEGHLVHINTNKFESIDYNDKVNLKNKYFFKRNCIFELIYIARPDSNIFGYSVYSFRRNLGILLAKQNPIKADLVIAVPDSGIPSAIGYAQYLNIPYDQGLLRNHYTYRTFIDPSSKSERRNKIYNKLSPIESIIKDKVIAVIDDSIVRGSTSREIVDMLRKSGAQKVHFLSSSPMIKYSCHYGISTPKNEELIANNRSLNEINKFIGSDTISYLNLNTLLEYIKDIKNKKFCIACMDGNYPIPIK